MFATFLASAAVIAFLAANVRKYKNKKGGKITNAVPMPKMYSYISAFAAGIVTSNGLFHFLHGILGYGQFPAPFAKILGHGVSRDVSNVVWGLFNFAAAFVLIMRCKGSATKWILVLLFIVGIAVMSLLLKFVFLSGYFKTHPF